MCAYVEDFIQIEIEQKINEVRRVDKRTLSVHTEMLFCFLKSELN